MKSILIKDIHNYEGQKIEILGWLTNKRSSGSIHFLVFRDGTGIIQAVVVKSDVSPEIFQTADKLIQETSCKITGIVKKEPRSPTGFELVLETLEIINLSSGYPISSKEHGTDFLMDYRHLWLRSPRQNAILKIRAEIIKACRNFFDKEGFILIDAPILTPAACEGTTNLFQTDYFEQSAYLTQSGQLYMEAACMAFNKVYCFGPTFRAEKSKTRRHLTEFWMIEPEMAFVDLEENLKIQEKMLTYIVESVLSNREKELKFLKRDTSLLKKVAPPFKSISYDEVATILKKEGLDFQWGQDLGSPEETLLSNKFEKPFFIHRFPVECKAFYMKTDPKNSKLALCADMLAPEGYGEITGGGQREDNLEVLETKIKEHDLPLEVYQWYLDLRRYGSVPHSGFGLGIERTVAWICKLDHVRETIPFPRMLSRIYP